MKKLHFNIQNLRKNTWTPAAAINTTVKDPILSGSQTKKPIFKEITKKKDDSWESRNNRVSVSSGELTIVKLDYT